MRLSLSGWTYWCASLHTSSQELKYPLFSPNPFQHISGREERNNYFQKKNWAKPKGECWFNVGSISHRKAYKIPVAVISAAGSTHMFWSDSLPLSELDLTEKNKLFFYSRSILPRYQHLHRETVFTRLLSLHAVHLVHKGKGYRHKAEKGQHYWGAAWEHPTWGCSITHAKEVPGCPGCQSREGWPGQGHGGCPDWSKGKRKLQPCKQRQETLSSLLKVIPPPSASPAPAVSLCALFAMRRKGSWRRWFPYTSGTFLAWTKELLLLTLDSCVWWNPDFSNLNK